jgi:hypothetical protein
MARFITDAGSTVILTETATGEELDIGRYGVWGDKDHWSGKPEVIDCGNDLEALQAEHGPDLPVHTFNQLREQT